MQDQDRKDLYERYRKRWEQYGFDSRTLGWNKDCQWVRFEAVFEGLREEDFASVLDVGCGFGDLLGYLRSKGWRGRYIGVDLMCQVIGEARKRHITDGAAEFFCGDMTRLDQSWRSDLAVGEKNSAAPSVMYRLRA